MLAAPFGTITLLHYAECLANIPDKRIRRYRRLVPAARGPKWIEFEEFDTSLGAHAAFPGNCFEVIAGEYRSEVRGRSGLVGNASSHLLTPKILCSLASRGWSDGCLASDRK